MRKISEKVKQKLLQEPDICSLVHLGGCAGGITWEHALIYAGRQIDEAWAIIKLCEKHHGVNSYQDVTAVDKERSIWVALNKATDKELLQYSKVINYVKERKRLNEKYGVWTPPKF